MTIVGPHPLSKKHLSPVGCFVLWDHCFWGQMISSAICPRIVSTAISQPWPSILQPVTVCVQLPFQMNHFGVSLPRRRLWERLELRNLVLRLFWREPTPPSSQDCWSLPSMSHICLLLPDFTARFSTACHSFLKKCAVLFLLCDDCLIFFST